MNTLAGVVWFPDHQLYFPQRAGGRTGLPPCIALSSTWAIRRAILQPETSGMAVERTLSIIKPDAPPRNPAGAIVDRFEKACLRVVASRRIRLSTAQAEAFYGVHR